MKLRTLVFVAPALALLVGLGPVVLAGRRDPDKVTATGPGAAVTGMEQEVLDRLNDDAHDEDHNRIHDAHTAQAYLADFQALYAAQGDETLCPRRIFLPLVMSDSSDVIIPPFPILPRVFSLDCSSVEAGADLRVKLEYHQPAGRYDVYLYNPALGYAVICTDLMTDAFGSVPQATCNVPAATVPGCYRLVSIAAGGDMDPANHVAEGDLVEVLSPVAPVLVIQEGNRWPAGATIRVNLRGHAPNRTYRLHWVDGGTGATTDMGSVTTDHLGNTAAPVAFRIPPDTADSPPVHRIVSFEEGGGGEIVASVEVEVVTP